MLPGESVLEAFRSLPYMRKLDIVRGDDGWFMIEGIFKEEEFVIHCESDPIEHLRDKIRYIEGEKIGNV